MSKRKEKPSTEELSSSLSSMLVPDYLLKDFDIYSTQESNESWTIELREKPERIPEELSGEEDVVLDGYCNPIEIQSSVFILKPVYFKCYRRRWKRSNQDRHYSNSYSLTFPQTKLVKEMAEFFKK